MSWMSSYSGLQLESLVGAEVILGAAGMEQCRGLIYAMDPAAGSVALLQVCLGPNSHFLLGSDDPRAPSASRETL